MSNSSGTPFLQQNCDIPHNTLGLSCNGREGLEWVSEMMSKNVEHKPTKFPELPDRPTPADLEIVPEGRGVRSASIF